MLNAADDPAVANTLTSVSSKSPISTITIPVSALIIIELIRIAKANRVG